MPPPNQRRAPSLFTFAAIGSILLAFGAVMLWLAIGFFEEHDSLYGAAAILAALILFCAFGGVLLWGKTVREKALSPQPWLNRADWAKGEIAARENATSVIGLCVIGAAATFAAAFLFISESAEDLNAKDGGLKWVCVLFGVVFLAGAIHTAIFRHKFGKSLFKMKSVPGVVGGNLTGNIDVGARLDAKTDFKIELRCLKLQPRRSGSDAGTNANILWESATDAHADNLNGNNSTIPVKFEIPAGCAESEAPMLADRIMWQLEARASVPGVDYVATFEVPVFKIDSAVQPPTK